MIDTINTVCKEVAVNLGVEEILVRKVYKDYWKTVKGAIASGKHTSVWLRSIGTLTISRTKVNKAIKLLILRIRSLKLDKLPSSRKTKEQRMIETINELRLLCARRNEIAIAYKANADRIKAKYAAKTKGHLGVQALDTTGSG